MKVSLIVSVYRNIPYLEFVLKALNLQTYHDLEVIVAEDNDSAEMRDFLGGIKTGIRFPLLHLSQPDEGFRKNRILNEAIRVAQGELLLFIDGDCFLHPEYVSQYARNAERGVCLGGRRVLLDGKTTADLIKKGSSENLSLFGMLWNGSRHVEDGIYAPFISRRINYLLGSNMGMLKSDFLRINGFDEDYQRPCVGEDNDVEWRLKAAGIAIKSMRFKAVQYHLHHEKPYGSEEHAVNYALMQEKQKAGKFFCKNGVR